MKAYLTAAESEDLFSRLPELRNRFSTAEAVVDRVELSGLLAGCCLRLGFLQSADDWLRAVQPFPEDQIPPAALRTFLKTQVELRLEQGDASGALRSLDKLRPIVVDDLEGERTVSLALVRLALLNPEAEPFSALEKAFRHHRLHPSARSGAVLWAAKAEWQRRQGRTEECQASLKKALAEAQKSGEPGLEAAAWILLARSVSTPRAKALRAAKAALERGEQEPIPQAVADAASCLSELTQGRERESFLWFRRSVEGAQAVAKQGAEREREVRQADARVFEASSEGRRLREAQLLASIVSTLATGDDLARSLDTVYQPLRTLMAADIFGVALWDPQQKALDYAFFIEEGRRTRVGLIPVDSPRSLGAWCFREQRSLRINDIDQEYSSYLKELSRLSDHRPKSMLFQPLVGRRGPLGLVSVQAFSRGSYTAEAEAHLSVIASCLVLRLQDGLFSGASPASKH